MALQRLKWRYQWWRVDKSANWEPVAIRTNSNGEEIVKFLGVQLWSFKSRVGGQFGSEIKGETDERKSN